jgi:acyl-ACP thioesterase
LPWLTRSHVEWVFLTTRVKFTSLPEYKKHIKIRTYKISEGNLER